MRPNLSSFLRFALTAGLILAGHSYAQGNDEARKKCIEFGFKDKTTSHDNCMKQFLQSTGAAKAPSKPATVTSQTSAAELEEKFWDATLAAGNKEAFAVYLENYPRGRYAGLARANVTRLDGAASAQQQALMEASEKLAIERAAFESEKKLARERAVAEAAIRAAATLSPGQVIKDCTECPEMVVIPTGSFTMGSSAAEQALANTAGVAETYTRRENPLHRVNIRSFAAGRYAISKGEFAAFVRDKGYQTEAERADGCFFWNGKEWKKDAAFNWRNVSFTQADNHPVVCISWNDVQAYISWLNQTSGQTYRLLSESEREYVARGGAQSTFWWGDSVNIMQANYAGTAVSYNGSPRGNYRQATMPVTSFSPNPFGLYNVHGNVWEWVEDCWHDNYSGAPADGSAWTNACSGVGRVIRGGSWLSSPAILRAAYRNTYPPGERSDFIGLRLARTLQIP
jgi:formylglycine-generating enzyme required for sulfatase activity